MFTLPVVKSCPYTVVGRGTIKISHTVLSTLAGAVYDQIEWLAFLIGTRSENGLEITVKELRVPLQHRSTAACSLVDPEILEPDVVGVIHSHHHMPAFFSQIDDSTLNPRFPASIVIAHFKNGSTTERLFGFNYKAEGRAQLPCGSLGIVPFTLLPDPLLPDWPESVQVGYGEPNCNASLFYCPHKIHQATGISTISKAPCGVNTAFTTKAAFGKESDSFIKEVEKNTRPSPKDSTKGWPYVNQGYSGKGYSGKGWEDDNRLYDDRLRHWSDWG